MADSIPSLRRKNLELAERIAELEAQISERVVEYVDIVREFAVEVPVVQQGSPVLVGVPTPYAVETVRDIAFPVEVPVPTPVYYTKEIPVDKIVYVDNPIHLEMIASLQRKVRDLTDGRYD